MVDQPESGYDHQLLRPDQLQGFRHCGRSDCGWQTGCVQQCGQADAAVNHSFRCNEAHPVCRNGVHCFQADTDKQLYLLGHGFLSGQHSIWFFRDCRGDSIHQGNAERLHVHACRRSADNDGADNRRRIHLHPPGADEHDGQCRACSGASHVPLLQRRLQSHLSDRI